MGLFDSKVEIKPLLDGYTDRHCHILPGVDDGYQSMEYSLHTLSLYEDAGVREVWFTPHIMDDFPNTTADLRSRFDELKSKYNGKLVLHLAAENMIDNVFDERLEINDLLPQSEMKLLVETSYFNPPMDLWGTLDKVRAIGYYPLLAHPERYVYMGEKDYVRLKNMGVLFQLNILSVLGAYGEGVQEKALTMLKKGFYDYSGTDLHRERAFLILESAKLKKKHFKLLQALLEKDK